MPRPVATVVAFAHRFANRRFFIIRIDECVNIVTFGRVVVWSGLCVRLCVCVGGHGCDGDGWRKKDSIRTKRKKVESDVRAVELRKFDVRELDIT